MKFWHPVSSTVYNHAFIQMQDLNFTCCFCWVYATAFVLSVKQQFEMYCFALKTSTPRNLLTTAVVIVVYGLLVV